MNVVAIAALLMPQAVPATAAPLAPTGKWLVEGADSMCVLSHAYGADPAKVTIGWRPWPMGQKTEIVVMETHKGASPKSGTAVVSLTPNMPIRAYYTSHPIPASDLLVTMLTVDQASLTAWQAPRR